MIRTLNLPLTKDDGTKALTTQRGNLGPSLIGMAAEPNGSHRGVMRFPPGNVVASMDGRTDGRTAATRTGKSELWRLAARSPRSLACPLARWLTGSGCIPWRASEAHSCRNCPIKAAENSGVVRRGKRNGKEGGRGKYSRLHRGCVVSWQNASIWPHSERGETGAAGNGPLAHSARKRKGRER